MLNSNDTNVFTSKLILFAVLPIVALSLLVSSTIAAPSETNLQPRNLFGGVEGGFNIFKSGDKSGGLGLVGSISNGISGIGSAVHNGMFEFTKSDQLKHRYRIYYI